MAMVAKFVSISITPAARNALRQLTLTLSVNAGRRLSMSDAIIALAAATNPRPDHTRTAPTHEETPPC